jgi:hypothetical protein
VPETKENAMNPTRTNRPGRTRRLVVAAVAAGTLTGAFSGFVPTPAGAGMPTDEAAASDEECEIAPALCLPPEPPLPDHCDDSPQICDTLTSPTTDPDPDPDPDPSDEGPGPSGDVGVSPRFTG